MEKKKIELKLYNTMSQQKEIFQPITPGKIGMSFCLITADDISHLGHARAAVCFDILYRFLRHLNYEVNLVRNVTHVDDKLIEKTKESDENPLDFSSCFYASYLKDMDVLQCLGSNNQPRLRDHREQIVKMIEKIIAKGFGYQVGSDVFFSVDKSPNYGQLSGQLLDHTRAAKCDEVYVDFQNEHHFG